MNWIKEHEIDSWLLRGTVALMLLFPAFYSPYTDVYQSAYYAGFSWAYFWWYCIWQCGSGITGTGFRVYP